VSFIWYTLKLLSWYTRVIEMTYYYYYYYYYHLSVLVLFLTVTTLTNIAGNPKYQIHAQTDGPIIYQPPTTDPQKSVALNQQRHRKLPQEYHHSRNPEIRIPSIPHLPLRKPIRPPTQRKLTQSPVVPSVHTNPVLRN
jgi:hypothetical protein